MSSFRAYAKINLGLLVLEKRPDGFHTIETVFHRINLFDEIQFVRSLHLHVVSSDDAAPDGEENICFKAATLLQRHLAVQEGVTISIAKNIPVGAGLGGGSSDAALVLRKLPQFWNRTIDDHALRSMALLLGSDVPYFLGEGSALATGRGEVLQSFALDIPYTILLCNPNIRISTAWAYGQVKPHPDALDLKGILTEGMARPEILTERLRNDFETPVFQHYPQVKRVKEDMLRGGAVCALMSGSGSSVFGLFASQDAAEQTSLALQAQGYRTFLTPPHFNPENT